MSFSLSIRENEHKTYKFKIVCDFELLFKTKTDAKEVFNKILEFEKECLK